MKSTPPTFELVRKLLNYDPETGFLTWKVDRNNGTRPGDRAGGLHVKAGYRNITIMNISWREHRIIWLWMKGEWPNHLLDHIDGNRVNNRWSNLRFATPLENSRNAGLPKDNTSGYRGVVQSRGRWKAQIKFNGRSKHLGVFDTKEEAALAYETAAKDHFGEFYRDLRSARAAMGENK